MDQAPAATLLGHPRLHLRRTGSTNDRARELAIAGAPHGTLVTADEQSAGRGRQGRTWSAPPGSSLLMSLVLRTGLPSGEGMSAPLPSPAPPPPLAPAPLPLLAAVAVCDVAGPDARVKWPNDIVRVEEGERLHKLAGILVEGRPREGWAVLGIGLNVAVRLQDLPPELHDTAATLGLPRSEIEPLLAHLLTALVQRLADPAARTLEAWRARDALRGREISWEGERGRAEGIDDEGRLIVTRDDGTRTELDAGEVLPA